MEAERGKKQDGSAQTDPSPSIGTRSGATNQVRLPAAAIFKYLANNPDIAGLLREYPQLTAEDLRGYFAEARSLVHGATTVTFTKGANRTAFSRTHGLPAPDPSIHKGNIFRALVALLKPGRMLDLGA